MKPRTTIELEVMQASAKLPSIKFYQLHPAFPKCFQNYAVQSRRTMCCLECGNTWRLASAAQVAKTQCPECNRKLAITDRYKNRLQETDYCQMITRTDKFQIIRMFCLTKYMKKNQAHSFFAHEVMQIFIDETGQVRIMAKNVMGMSKYFDQWIVGSTMTLKTYNHNRFHLRPGYIFPNRKILPILNRNGFKGNFHGIAPQVLFRGILTDNISETLLKSNQLDLLRYHIQNTPLKPTGKYWNAIRICNRNGYVVKDAKTWIDYLGLLDHFNKDLRSPKYLCPANLEQAHDRLMNKKQEAIIKETFEKKKKQIAKNQASYFKAKQHFFGLVISEKNISIEVIETVKAFLEEGCTHRHCVFTNEYYRKKNSLIMSAKVNGIPTETVQVSLENFEVLQSRGRGNKASAYNKAIISLVNRNMHQIRARVEKAA